MNDKWYKIITNYRSILIKYRSIITLPKVTEVQKLGHFSFIYPFLRPRLT